MAAMLALAIPLFTLTTSTQTTTTLPPPAAGLGLIPGPAVGDPAPVLDREKEVTLLPGSPTPGDPDRTLFFAGAAAALLAAFHSAAAQRKRQIAAIPTAPADLTVLFVAGFDQPPESEYAQLVQWLGLKDDQIRYFDYRLVEPVDDHEAATRRAENDELVDGLHSYLAGMASMSDGPIYLVGFSKGGAGIARLLKRWDLHPATAVPSVVGAALLDPPISGGVAGMLQSAGSFLSRLPNDGGYRPSHCRLLGQLGCHDTRVDLGKRSGVEVVVFRHEDAQLANFGDHPDGLRIYELEGGLPAGLGLGERISTAHKAVFTSPAVAACIAQEMRRARTCRWEED